MEWIPLSNNGVQTSLLLKCKAAVNYKVLLGNTGGKKQGAWKAMIKVKLHCL